MAAIYITGITIAMLNITGIGFVIFIILFNPFKSKLKKSNLKKSTTINDSIQNSIQTNGNTSHTGAKSETADSHEENNKEGGSVPKSSAGTVAAAGSITAVSDTLNSGDKKTTSDFDNIDDILDDLDLSDFDDLDLDDFN